MSVTVFYLWMGAVLLWICTVVVREDRWTKQKDKSFECRSSRNWGNKRPETNQTWTEQMFYYMTYNIVMFFKLGMSLSTMKENCNYCLLIYLVCSWCQLFSLYMAVGCYEQINVSPSPTPSSLSCKETHKKKISISTKPLKRSSSGSTTTHSAAQPNNFDTVALSCLLQATLFLLLDNKKLHMRD